MKLRTRLALWYATIFSLSLLVIGLSMYYDLVVEQRAIQKQHHAASAAVDEDAGEDIVQILLIYGGTAVAVGLLGGWWLTRRALAPVTTLTLAAESIQDHNLNQQLPRTRNGDELDRLTDVFNAMTRRLDDSFQRVREFTLHASHELKTPLTVLRGEIETALRNESMSAAERERAVSQLAELRRLTRIVEGLTFLAKADAGQFKPAIEKLQMDDLVRECHADLEILAEPQGIQVRLGACEPAAVQGDRHRLRQLLLNLADNAVKYNQPQGRIALELRRAGGVAELKISNTGKGIAREQLPQVFDRFYRGEAASSQPAEGCGLGLSIAQSIVHAHRGEIKIDSEPMGLTTVTVNLPME